MRLTRRALRREVRVLEARARLDSTTIEAQRRTITKTLNRAAELQAALDALRAEPRAAVPALADNVRLAHLLEVAEHLQHQAEMERDALMSRLVLLAARHPHVFAGDELAS